MRRLAVCAVSGCLVGGLVAACGESDETQVREVVEDFQAALRAGNAEAACELLSKAAKAKLIVNVRGDALLRPPGSTQIDTCVDAVPALFDPEASTKVTEVRVDGDRARGRIDLPSLNLPNASGTRGLIREGDHWRIGPKL